MKKEKKAIAGRQKVTVREGGVAVKGGDKNVAQGDAKAVKKKEDR